MVSCFSLFLSFFILAGPQAPKGDVKIRVGLGKTDSQPLFFYKGSVQVLDGDKVVDTLRLDGRFWIIHEPAQQDIYCLRVESGPKPELETHLAELKKNYPQLSYYLINHTGKKHPTLETGKIFDRQAALDFLREHKNLGYKDTLLIKLKSAVSKLSLVDRLFNKHDLGDLKKPGLKPLHEDEPITFSGKEYRGILRLRWSGSTFKVINEIELETYLRGVVPGEMGPVVYPRLEALKAQAIAARTYAIKNLGRFKDKGYDICDTPRCQVYEGVQVEQELSDQAISETKGLVMTSNGELIDALYTSTCGGATDPVGHVFPGRNTNQDPYLAGTTSYLKTNSGWKMNLPRNQKLSSYSDLQIRALLMGIKNPQTQGDLDSASLTSWLKQLKPIFGGWPEVPPEGPWSIKRFLDFAGTLPFVKKSAKLQCTVDDVARFSKYSGLSVPLEWFFLLRYGALTDFDIRNPDRIATKKETLGILVHLAEVFGPEITWQRFFVDHLTDKGIIIRDWNGVYEYPLDQLELVLTKSGDKWMIQDADYFQMWDMVYLMNGTQDNGVIYLRPNGWAASVDRSSPYSSWIEKKTLPEIEELTRAYLPAIHGIKDIKILSQSPTGRVKELLVVADSGKHHVEGLLIRRILGIRDTLFEFLPQYKNGRLTSVTFVGKGWGHGVGMSQVGAFGLALEGWTYDQILKHYYKDVEIVPYQTL